jgi:lysophospholipase L1-like esterase
LKYIALGDSYTIGSSVDSADRFPAQAALWMRSNGKALSRVDYIATSGWPTGALLNAISASTMSRNYDLATLLIGVNNQYQRRDTGEYALEFVQCLRRAIDFAGGRKDRVFVLSIPDYSVTPFAINSDRPRIAREIDQFNAINKRLTDSAGISYTDITDISREAAVFPLLIANDGLHPSGAMYKRWADRLAPKMLAVLK